MASTVEMNEAYEPWRSLLLPEAMEKCEEFNSENHTLAQYLTEISNLTKPVSDINKRSKNMVHFNMVMIDCTAVKLRLAARSQELVQVLQVGGCPTADSLAEWLTESPCLCLGVCVGCGVWGHLRHHESRMHAD